MKIKKSELNQNIHLSEGNIKSKGTEDTMFLTWSLPSRSTCPYATTECKKRCFAKKNESFKGVTKLWFLILKSQKNNNGANGASRKTKRLKGEVLKKWDIRLKTRKKCDIISVQI